MVFLRRGQEFAYFVLASFLCFSLAQSSWASGRKDWQKVVERARKEGRVVVSVPPNAELRKQMEGVFERRFPGIDL
ncbi:MAG: hypothetical protein ACE5JO_12495, partial [Candidatus Binatia bacterium]